MYIFPYLIFAKGTPNKPSNIQVSNIDTNKFTVTWTEPDIDGGYPVTDYTVEYKAVSQLNWNRLRLDIASATSVVVIGLEEGTEYELRVAAMNSVGTGPFLQMLEACKTLGKFTLYLT